MLKNYILISLRNLKKYKLYSFINITGLAVGLSCCVMIFLFINHELSFDDYHNNADRIYRILLTRPNDLQRVSAVTAAKYATDLKFEFSEIKQAIRFRFIADVMLSYKKEIRSADKFAYVDPEVFFKVFDFNLIQGNPETVLINPNSIVLTRDAAIVYFGKENPIGQTMTLLHGSKKINLSVTGIMESFPSNSHMRFDYFVPFRLLGKKALEDYGSHNYFTYLMFKPDTPINDFKKRLPAFHEKYVGEGSSEKQSISLQPLEDIHLTTDLRHDSATTASKNNLFIFGFVALFVLIVACINFMNLATARSTLRSKEVGIRKVVGAKRIQLIRQFFFESMWIHTHCINTSG